jgi:hypothetical protein
MERRVSLSGVTAAVAMEIADSPPPSSPRDVVPLRKSQAAELTGSATLRAE